MVSVPTFLSGLAEVDFVPVEQPELQRVAVLGVLPGGEEVGSVLAEQPAYESAEMADTCRVVGSATRSSSVLGVDQLRNMVSVKVGFLLQNSETTPTVLIYSS